MRINRLLFTKLFVLWLVQLTGQPLGVLLDTARVNNLELRALHQEYLAALEKAPQARSWPDPEIGVGFFLAPVETRLGAQRLRLNASQMFPWFGTREAKEEVAVAEARAAFEWVATRELDLIYQVSSAYFRLYEMEASQNIIRRNIRILQTLRQLTISKVESGKASTADILRADLKIQELKQELLILENKREKPLADLNQVLNRPLDTPVETPDSVVFAVLPFAKDTLMNHIRDNHPMIRMFALQQEASRKALELNAVEDNPSFGVGMDYIWVDPRTDADPANNGRDIFMISARVSIPLYRKNYAAKEQEENLRIAALEDRKSDSANLFYAMIEKAYTDFETARLREELYRQQIATTQAAIQILQVEYSSTGRNFDELLHLEKDLVDYDLKILQAIIQSQLAKAAIERYITF